MIIEDRLSDVHSYFIFAHGKCFFDTKPIQIETNFEYFQNISFMLCPCFYISLGLKIQDINKYQVIRGFFIRLFHLDTLFILLIDN